MNIINDTMLLQSETLFNVPDETSVWGLQTVNYTLAVTPSGHVLESFPLYLYGRWMWM